MCTVTNRGAGQTFSTRKLPSSEMRGFGSKVGGDGCRLLSGFNLDEVIHSQKFRPRALFIFPASHFLAGDPSGKLGQKKAIFPPRRQAAKLFFRPSEFSSSPAFAVSPQQEKKHSQESGEVHYRVMGPIAQNVNKIRCS